MEGVNPTTKVFDVDKVRKDFPILTREIYGKPLIYLDNGASAQKPIQVIRTVEDYYTSSHSNVHRGVHFLSQEATERFENVRVKTKEFLNAKHQTEVIFTKGTTEAINLVAFSYGRKNLEAGDEVLISTMEHHSNIVPWQMLCEEKGAHLKVIPINDEGELLMAEFEKLINERTKIVAVNHVSNTLGTINPVKNIIDKAHDFGAVVLIDGAQATPHMKVDVQALDCDFYAFSSHKTFGPTGVGVLYGKENILNEMPPYQGGGEMIKTVTFEKTTYNQLPHKFEAGTPDIAGVIGFGAALDYINTIGYELISAHEEELLAYATDRLSTVEGMRFIGTAANKAAVLSFLVGEIHPYDLGVILDKLGIAVRTGHHCTEPLMSRLGVPGTVRASFALYNTKEEVDVLVKSVKKAAEMLG